MGFPGYDCRMYELGELLERRSRTGWHRCVVSFRVDAGENPLREFRRAARAHGVRGLVWCGGPVREVRNVPSVVVVDDRRVYWPKASSLRRPEGGAE